MGVSLKALESEIRAQNGNIAAVARAFDMTWHGVYDRVKRSERLQKAVDESRDSKVKAMGDKAFEMAMDGNVPILIFLLKTMGKNDGYTERTEISGPDNGPIVIKGYTNVTPDDWDNQ